MRIGVLALQGAFHAHKQVLAELDQKLDIVEVRNTKELNSCDGLIIPGGESTVISKLIRSAGLEASLASFVSSKCVWGTCAGMIVLASQIQDADPDLLSLNAIDISVARNAYGRQRDSFESRIEIDNIEDFPSVFIRAPAVTCVGPGVNVLGYDKSDLELAAELNPEFGVSGIPAVMTEANIMVSSFHPELTGDSRLHAKFVDMVQSMIDG